MNAMLHPELSRIQGPPNPSPQETEMTVPPSTLRWCVHPMEKVLPLASGGISLCHLGLSFGKHL